MTPRKENAIAVSNFSLTVQPQPQGISHFVDLDGNNLTKLWFAPTPTKKLTIQTLSTVETYRTNPFDYLLEPWAITIPFDYPSSLQRQLQPYLLDSNNFGDRSVAELAQDIFVSTEGNTLNFLFNLNQRIYKDCNYTVRETGAPFPPGYTWRNKQGSCRDFVVLFMAVCRTMGIATRFVSGYQEGDKQQQNRDLHAWVEVYLPGAGWQGYDPTLGLVVCDRHIPLAASAIPQYTAAVSGSVIPVTPGEAATSTLESKIAMEF